MQVEDIYGLSPMQQGMLFYCLVEERRDVYVEQRRWSVSGGLDEEAFGAAWRWVVSRHAVLRTEFEWSAVDDPVQVVLSDSGIEVSRHECGELSGAERDEFMARFMADDRSSGVDLSRAPLMRLNLFRFSDGSYEFVWTFHHILLDGWSTQLIFRDVLAAYESFRAGGEYADGGNPPPDYRDYIAWLERQDQGAAEDFWRAELDGFTEATLFPDRPARAGAGSGFEELELDIPEWLAGRMKGFCRENRVTLNTLLQGAWGFLLGGYSGQDDVVFGGIVSGRPPSLPDVGEMVGLFVNTLPVRVRIRWDASAGEWLRELQDRQSLARQFDYARLVDIHGWAGVPRDVPLFQSVLVFENYPRIVSSGSSSIRIKSRTGAGARTNYPLVVLAVGGDRPRVIFGYDPALFGREFVVGLGGHFRNLLESVVADPGRRVSELGMLGEGERALLAGGWQAAAGSFRAGACVHELFEERARVCPGAVAVVCGGTEVSFGELNGRANRVAGWLREQGVGPESVVGICARRGVEMVVGLLGVLKAGGAFLPLDPDYPPERLGFMAGDAGVAAVLAQRAVAGMVPDVGAPVACLDEEGVFAGRPSGDVPSGAVAGNAAYVIYTSGSTGRPKGVTGTHAGLVNRLAWFADAYPDAQAEVVCAKSSFSFIDGSTELLGSLLYGTTAVVADSAAARDPAQVLLMIQRYGVGRVVVTPTLLATLLDNFAMDEVRSCRYWIVSGEALPSPVAARFMESLPQAHLLNLYGPTEASIDVTSWRCRPGWEGPVPIGRPIANMRAYVLDGALSLVPVGVAGELFIGGVGVARGYRGRPGLTAERFVPDPFGTAGERLYRTGDRVRWRADGNLEFLGRLDDQVKVRGFRVEPGEVEAVLRAHPAVAQAAVVARDDGPSGRRLVAYVTGLDGARAGELRGFARERLPEYMVPSAFVALPALPLTPNGKLDRRALPEPEGLRPEWAGQYAPPRTPAEDLVAGIWSQVLGVERVGIHDNFFALGGNSISVMRVTSRMQESVDHAITTDAVFDNPTVAELVAFLGKEMQNDRT